MKNKLIHLISILLLTATCFSCSNDDNNNSDEYLIGTWNYSGETNDIHFEFEYNSDKISFPEGMIPSGILSKDIPNGIDVSLIKMMLPGIGNKYMSKYFQGIKFISEDEMEILMTVKEQPITLKTNYITQKDIIKINIQSPGFKELLGTMIPVNSIDLNYKINNDELTVYLNTLYVKIILIAVPTILDSAELPEEQKTIIKEFIQTFSNNLETFEFGVKLTK